MLAIICSGTKYMGFWFCHLPAHLLLLKKDHFNSSLKAFLQIKNNLAKHSFTPTNSILHFHTPWALSTPAILLPFLYFLPNCLQAKTQFPQLANHWSTSRPSQGRPLKPGVFWIDKGGGDNNCNSGSDRSLLMFQTVDDQQEGGRKFTPSGNQQTACWVKWMGKKVLAHPSIPSGPLWRFCPVALAERKSPACPPEGIPRIDPHFLNQIPSIPLFLSSGWNEQKEKQSA